MNSDLCNTNVLILGKTGSGKSSLINYLYGRDMVIGKAGAPVTVKGFHKQPSFVYKSLNITVYDSWGIEADKTHEWRQLLKEELRKTDSSSITEWFHTVIYCFDAKSSRLDDFEKTEIIQKLIDGGVRLIFALTKWDLCSDAEKTAAVEVIKSSYKELDYVPVCSVSKKLRSGIVTKTLGREELFKFMCLNLRENLVYKTITLAKEKLDRALSKAEEKIIEYYNEKTGPVGIFTYYDDDLLKAIEDKSYKVYSLKTNDIPKFINENFCYINEICTRVIESYSGKKVDVDGFQNIIRSEFFKTGIQAWDNSWAEDIATVVTTLLSAGIFQFLKKGMYEDKLKEALKSVSCHLKEKLNQWIEEQEKNEGEIKKLYLTYLE